MGCNNFWGIFILMFAGCATARFSEQSMNVKSYQHAVKQQVSQILEEGHYKVMPDYHWSAPLVQEISIPGHIDQGAFIPEHKELVMIKPGEWIKESEDFVIQQKEKYVPNSEDHDFNTVADITSVPNHLGASGTVEYQGKGRNNQ